MSAKRGDRSSATVSNVPWSHNFGCGKGFWHHFRVGGQKLLDRETNNSIVCCLFDMSAPNIFDKLNMQTKNKECNEIL